MGADGINLETGPVKTPQRPVVKPVAQPVRGQNGQTWKRVAIGGVAGIMVGTAGAAAATVAYHQFFNDDEEDTAANDAETTAEAEATAAETAAPAYRTLDNGMRVADIDESASFTDAFNAAREQVGPDGVFHWHGNVYSTHTEAEWNSMTPSERSEFVHNASAEYGAASADQPAQETAHAATAQAQHTAHAEPAAHTEQNTNTHHEEADNDVAVHTASNHGDDDVQIVGVEEVRLADGSTATMATTNVQGHEVYMVDVDHDGIFDVAAMDANGNGQLEENELMDISQHNIDVASVSNAAPAPDMGGDPDLSNDPGLTADATTASFDETPMDDYSNDVSGDLLV